MGGLLALAARWSAAATALDHQRHARQHLLDLPVPFCSGRQTAMYVSYVAAPDSETYATLDMQTVPQEHNSQASRS